MVALWVMVVVEMAVTKAAAAKEAAKEGAAKAAVRAAAVAVAARVAGDEVRAAKREERWGAGCSGSSRGSGSRWPRSRRNRG